MAANNQIKMFMLSGFKNESEKKYILDVIKRLGGKYIESPIYLPESDYVICKCPTRGEKYLCGCAEGKPLLIPSYINDCEKAGRWLGVTKYDWRNQSWNETIDKKLLELPKACQGHIEKNGSRIFGKWKVLLHVEPKQRYKAYKRLLLAGGAKIIPLKPPFLKDVRHKITHAFVTKDLTKDLKPLKKEKFLEILYPEYIAEYLIQQPIHPHLVNFRHFVNSIRTPTKQMTPQKSPRKPILSKIQMQNQRTITELFCKRKSVDNANEPPLKRQRNSPNSSSDNFYYPQTPTKVNDTLRVKEEPISPSSVTRNSPMQRKHSQDINGTKNHRTPNKQYTPNKQHEVIIIDSDDDDNVDDQKDTPLEIRGAIIDASNNINFITPNGNEGSKYTCATLATPVESSTSSMDVSIPIEIPGSIIDATDTIDLITPDHRSLEKESSVVIDSITPDCVTRKINMFLRETERNNNDNDGDDDSDDEFPMFTLNKTPKPDARKKINVEKNNLKSSIKREGNLKTTIAVFVDQPKSKSQFTSLQSREGDKSSLMDGDVQESQLIVTQRRKSDCTRKPKQFSDYETTPFLKKVKLSKSLSPKDVSRSGNDLTLDSNIGVDRKDVEPNTNKFPIKIETAVEAIIMTIPDTEFMRKTRNSSKVNVVTAPEQSGAKNGEEETSEVPPLTVSTSTSFSAGDVAAETTTLKVFSNVSLFSLQGNLRLYKRQSNTGAKTIKRKPLLHNFENIIESYVDEEDSSAFALMKEYISHFFHPTPKLWFAFMDLLKEQTQSFRRTDLFCILQTLPLLHPVNEMSSVYVLALRKPVEEDDGDIVPTMSIYDVVIENIRNCIAMLEEEVRPRDFRSHLLYITHIVNLMEVNFKDVSLTIRSLKKLGSPSEKVVKLRETLVWQMFWESRHHCTVNNNMKDFISIMLDLVQTATSNEGYALGQLLLTIFRLLAECLSLKDELTSSSSYGENASSFVSYCRVQCDQVIFSDKTTQPKTKAWFLSQLQPAWLKYRLLEFLFERFSDAFVPEKSQQLLKKKLTIDKIIHCYFFFHPYKTPPRVKHHTAKGSPLKNISNVTSPSLKKLLRKNAKGETPLLVACKKNQASKVKELLSLDADVNIKDNAGWSPLHEACCYGYENIVDLLLKSPTIDVFCTSEDGVSSLHDAAESNELKIAEKLLIKGGPKLLKLKTKDKKTAYDLAKTPEMKQLLSKHIQCGEEPKMTTNTIVTRLANYHLLSPLPPKDVVYYLLLLENLLKSFLAVEKCRVDSKTLKDQYLLLQQYVDAINGKKSLQCKLYLKSIAKLMRSL